MTPEEEWMERFAKETGYLLIRELPTQPGVYACLSRLAFTTAIITGVIGDDFNFTDRWCYHTEAHAAFALGAWDGEGEPTGWHRHPKSGRRLSVTGDEFDENGNHPKPGEYYIYH